jgi:hypothetical protein
MVVLPKCWAMGPSVHANHVRWLHLIEESKVGRVAEYVRSVIRTIDSASKQPRKSPAELNTREASARQPLSHSGKIDRNLLQGDPVAWYFPREELAHMSLTQQSSPKPKA